LFGREGGEKCVEEGEGPGKWKKKNSKPVDKRTLVNSRKHWTRSRSRGNEKRKARRKGSSSRKLLAEQAEKMNEGKLSKLLIKTEGRVRGPQRRGSGEQEEEKRACRQSKGKTQSLPHRKAR